MPNKEKKIVVVDDDSGMNQAMERLLRIGGYRPITFPSGEALLKAGGGEGAACFILDIHLPGISGFTLKRALGEHAPAVPVIFITAYDDVSARDEATRAGAIGFFTKPFSGRELLSAVARAVQDTEKPRP